MVHLAWPGCAQLNSASWWIHYIFTQNAAAVSLLLILYIAILSVHIAYNQHMDALSAFNHFIDNIVNAFRRSSFYRNSYVPYIRHYVSMFLLFIALLPLSFMYFDSLFQYRNDCTATYNSSSWYAFSIVFLIQFWYHGIKFILFSVDGIIPTTNNTDISDDDDVPTTTDETITGEVEDIFAAPSVPSMNAPKPMQIFDDDYEEQERGAIAEYNPFDSENDDDGNDNDDGNEENQTDYVVVPETAAIGHSQISLMQDIDTVPQRRDLSDASSRLPAISQTHAPPPPPPPAAPSPPALPIPPPDAPAAQSMGHEPIVKLKAAEYGNTAQIQQLIVCFKRTTIFFMILGIFVMVTTWNFIPYYAFNISSFTMFHVFIAPFVLIYRINVRFMSDYYTHDHPIRAVNDMPFVLFLLKISSLLIILNFCMTSSVFNSSLFSVLLYVILPMCCVYPWKVLSHMSSQLESIYDNMKRQHFDGNSHTFIRPIIPFGEIPQSIQRDNSEENATLLERDAFKSRYAPYDPPEAGQIDRLESVDLGDAYEHEVTEPKDIKSRPSISVQRPISYYEVHRSWIVHIASVVNISISFIAGLVQISSSANARPDWSQEWVWYSGAVWLVVYCVLLMLTVLYSLFVTIYPAAKSRKILSVLGSDTRRRLFVFLKSNLVLLQLNIILVTEEDGAKVVFTILYLISSVTLGVLTFDKCYKESYNALLKMPVKYPKMYAISRVISYAVSICVMVLWILHVNAVNKEQFLMIHSYVGIPFIWWVWCQVYNNDMYHFIMELKGSLRGSIFAEKDIPITHGSLYVVNELLMISSFIAFVICCAMAAKSYDGAQDGVSLFFLSVYLVLSLVVCINAFVAILSMQPPNQKGYKAAVFEPVLKQSLLTQDL